MKTLKKQIASRKTGMGGKNENTGWQLSKMYAVKNIWMYSHLSFYLLDPDTKD